MLSRYTQGPRIALFPANSSAATRVQNVKKDLVAYNNKSRFPPYSIFYIPSIGLLNEKQVELFPDLLAPMGFGGVEIK